ncbi:hypothetical protein PV325_002956 [Microctonus aethiopoides]|uniref:Large ribosomal subunit protein uL30m n=1 Tax=Microctonus aethiopoides TaxID=144406 RepID=A0AA39FMF1_9HYME|nr:hypothetical protein PV325_002956 [Microctonus aethiopoides]KAK0097109.1 hypothetical protein PV326_003246 [Microctonus aethiopoides]KAK0172081.1 hypothetical protein PV328_005449 [Microctonus aethiopoides]
MSRLMNFLIQVRNYATKPKKIGGVRYGLITYFPRHPDHQDPPITPTKLLMVKRVKPYKGNPYWHKKILDVLKLDEKSSDIAVVKNTPEICASLWEIKHLVKITPINLPENLPDDHSKATVLHENGDFLLAPRVDPARERATEEHLNNPKRLNREILCHELRMRWLNPYDT